MVLTAIDAMRDSSICDKQVACSLLYMAMRDPASWLIDVSSLQRDFAAHETFQAFSLPSPGVLGT